MKYKVILEMSRDSLFDELGHKRMRESYMKEEENSPQERHWSFAFFGSWLCHRGASPGPRDWKSW